MQVDPYRTLGDPKSGLLPGLHDGSPGEQGAGDHRVQAYNFRMCLTDDPKNRVPFPKPAGYDPLRYELGLRTILAGQWDGLGAPTGMPNRKTDTNNNGAFSSDNIGLNYNYPDGDYATRKKIWQEHVEYQQGWCWFLANDERPCGPRSGGASCRASPGPWGSGRSAPPENRSDARAVDGAPGPVQPPGPVQAGQQFGMGAVPRAVPLPAPPPPPARHPAPAVQLGRPVLPGHAGFQDEQDAGHRLPVAEAGPPAPGAGAGRPAGGVG